MKHRILALIGSGLFVAGCTADAGEPLDVAGGTDDVTATSGGGRSTGATTGSGGMPAGAETTAQSLARQQQENGWGPSFCRESPDGVTEGLGDEQRAPSDLTFRDCEGHDVDLAELCGADAVWLFFAHAWCPSCRSTGNRAEMLHDGFAGRNVASVQIVVEAGGGGPADEELCQRWRDDYEQGDVLTLFDPYGHHTPLVEGGYTALNVVLDEYHVITPKFHGSDGPTIETAIETAIAR